MANEIMIPEASSLPAYLQAAIAADPSLLQANLDAAAGISTGAPPTIVAVQGMFKTKVDGVEDVIQINVPGMGLINAPKISVVILKGKPAMDRAYFVGSYKAGQENVSPDCSSEDGVKPKADSPNKQCASCAGCPQNMWGSAVDDKGQPGKGKACAEKKRLAIATGSPLSTYRFNVPPASLGDFAAYAKQLAAHGLALSTVITTISFDPAAPTKLVFGFQGVLPEAAFAKIQGMLGSSEVNAIMDAFSAVPALPAPAATGPGDEEKKAQAAAAAEADKKAKADADKKAKAEKVAADKKTKEEVAKATAASASGGLDLGLGAEDVPAEPAANPIMSGSPSDEDLAALLGI